MSSSPWMARRATRSGSTSSDTVIWPHGEPPFSQGVFSGSPNSVDSCRRSHLKGRYFGEILGREGPGRLPNFERAPAHRRRADRRPPPAGLFPPTRASPCRTARSRTAQSPGKPSRAAFPAASRRCRPASPKPLGSSAGPQGRGPNGAAGPPRGGEILGRVSSASRRRFCRSRSWPNTIFAIRWANPAGSEYSR